MGQQIAECVFTEACHLCAIQEHDQTTDKTDISVKNYATMNRNEAIACALRVALKSRSEIQAESLHGNNDDRYDKFMRSSHAPTDAKEQNKQPLNYTKPLNTKYASNQHMLLQDKVHSSQPQHVTINRDFLIQTTGFHKSDFLIKHFNTISNNHTSLAAIDKNPDMDKGETATLKSNKQNKKLADTSHLKPEEVYNMDIAYGPTVAIGGIKYALILINRKTKRKLIYGLKNLTTSLQNAFKQFLVDVMVKPCLLQTDFDHRLIGGKQESHC